MRKLTVKDNQEKKFKKKEAILKEELFASEIRYRGLFESAKDGMLILDAETGKIVDANPYLMELLGYSKQNFIEKSIWEIGTFLDIFENKEKFVELQQKEYVRYDDLPLVTSDGREINVEFVSNVYLVNSIKVIQCQIRDITARKETEAALEKTRKELAEIKKTADELNKFTENVIDTVREPLLAIDKDLRVIKANRSFYNFFKVSADETIGKLIYELGNHQWDIPKLKELLEKIIPEKNPFNNYEVQHDFSTIGKRVMLLNARQVKRAFGKEKVILLAIEDITERKGREVSLEATYSETSDSLNILLNLMHAPIIIWDTSMIIKRFNRKFELLSGYKSAEVINKKIDLLFPKEKIDATLELLKDHLDDEHLEVTEVDILTKDNHIKTVLWNSSRILDEEGNNIVATISQDITSRKRLEDSLHLLETRYRRLFESSKDGILILDAENGKIVDVNPYLIDLLGYSKKEFIERSIWEIGAFHDIYENKEKFLELQQKEYVRYDDLPLVTSDGREIYVEFISHVYLANNAKAIQCNIRDITDRINKQNEINFQADLINNVGQAVIATDLSGQVTYWNIAAEKIYGWSASEAIGQNIIHLTPAQQSNEQAIDIMENLSAGKTLAGEFHVKRKDGSSFPAFVTNTPILDRKGELEGIIGISSDITERKHSEMELIEAKEKAEESDRLKTAFLQNISHEIRTPMNAIMGFSSFLNDPDLIPEKRQQYTDIIVQSSDQLLAIIDDIISIASIEARQEKIQENEINLNLICKLLYEQFSPRANEKHVTLRLKTLLADDQANIVTDASKLTQILTNLINNAVKFTQQGTINFGYKVKEDQLEFYVEDTGIGIPLDMQEIIFIRFRQAETSAARIFGGSGLGLSIAKAYVEMLGGKIWVASELGKGSLFYFTIPYKNAHPEKSPDIHSINGLNFEFGTTKTILIAEDEDSNFMLLEELLSDFEPNIIRAVNGLEAIELCKSNPQIDLVLMDIKMPEMNGYEATKQIRKFRPDLSIIAQTAYITEADRNRVLACGCSDFISKPISKNLLFLKINEQLHK